MADPVIIVGGGLAGLACAGAFEAKGASYRLFEASDRVGGRVRTDEVDGLRMDRGFQVYFPAYPTASRVLEGAHLDLRPWRNGAHVWDGERLRTLDRGRPLLTLRDGVLGLPDLARLLLLTAQTLGTTVERIRETPDATTASELRRRGFSDAALRRFFLPFYGGVFVDPALGVSRRQFMFVAKMLNQAPASLPNSGMETLSRALVARLSAVTVATPIEEVLRTPAGRVNGVRVGGERLPASRVVLAVDADAASALSGLPLARGWLGSVALYFESERPVVPDATIVLNGTGQGRVNEVAPITNAAPGYAPPGRHLLCAVVLGDPKEPDAMLVDEVVREVRTWFPGAGELRFVRMYRIPRHQLPQPPGFDAPPPEAPPGLILAGERVANCSIDGSIASGLRAAEACV